MAFPNLRSSNIFMCIINIIYIIRKHKVKIKQGCYSMVYHNTYISKRLCFISKRLFFKIKMAVNLRIFFAFANKHVFNAIWNILCVATIRCCNTWRWTILIQLISSQAAQHWMVEKIMSKCMSFWICLRVQRWHYYQFPLICSAQCLMYAGN